MPTRPVVLGSLAGIGSGMMIASWLVASGLHPYTIEILGALILGVASAARMMTAGGVPKPSAP